jgi:hypothetical protein
LFSYRDACFDSSLVKDYGNEMTGNEAIVQSIKNFKDSMSTNQMDGTDVYFYINL